MPNKIILCPLIILTDAQMSYGEEIFCKYSFRMKILLLVSHIYNLMLVHTRLFCTFWIVHMVWQISSAITHIMLANFPLKRIINFHYWFFGSEWMNWGIYFHYVAPPLRFYFWCYRYGFCSYYWSIQIAFFAYFCFFITP